MADALDAIRAGLEVYEITEDLESLVGRHQGTKVQQLFDESDRFSLVGSMLGGFMQDE